MLEGILLGYAVSQAASNVETNANAARASAKAQSVQNQIKLLEERVDRLILVNVAMWELVKERTQLTEEDLMQRVAEIDLRDGRADGKITRTVKKCGQCGKTMSAKHAHCLYCGAVDLSVSPFEEI